MLRIMAAGHRGSLKLLSRALNNLTTLSLMDMLGAFSGRFPSGQRGQTVNLLAFAFEGSNPSLPRCIRLLYMEKPFLIVRMSFYDGGLKFECTRCSRCCRHTPGYVFLSKWDLKKISRSIATPREEVIDRYCRTVDINGFKRLSLKEKANLDCIFWEKHGCTIYSSRPLQCRSFPFWSSNLTSQDTWRETAAGCQGIGRGPEHSRRKIDGWIRKRQREGLLSPDEV